MLFVAQRSGGSQGYLASLLRGWRLSAKRRKGKARKTKRGMQVKEKEGSGAERRKGGSGAEEGRGWSGGRKGVERREDGSRGEGGRD